jgi:peroxiredoxin (alkyl hydroperoxide reductase subunit C)
VKFKLLLLAVLLISSFVYGKNNKNESLIFKVDKLKPVDSQLKVKVGQKLPEIKLNTINKKVINTKQYKGKKNIVLSFIPAAWTPVCTGQWSGYNLIKNKFDSLDTVVLGISTDNIPTQSAWVKSQGGFWFPVLSDFWPHGKVASKLGILRSDGTTERAIFIIDKKGIIRYIDVHDINERPSLESIMDQLKKLQK